MRFFFFSSPFFSSPFLLSFRFVPESPSFSFRFGFGFGFGWTRVLVLMIIYRLMTRLVDGEWTDPDIPDPLTNMFDLLTERKDRQLTQKWGIWLTRKDSERAIKVRFYSTLLRVGSIPLCPVPHSVLFLVLCPFPLVVFSTVDAAQSDA